MTGSRANSPHPSGISFAAAVIACEARLRHPTELLVASTYMIVIPVRKMPTMVHVTTTSHSRGPDATCAHCALSECLSQSTRDANRFPHLLHLRFAYQLGFLGAP